MEYKLIITKENGDTSAELQTLDQSHRQAFNLLDVILDYTNIKGQNTESVGGLKLILIYRIMFSDAYSVI